MKTVAFYQHFVKENKKFVKKEFNKFFVLEEVGDPPLLVLVALRPLLQLLDRLVPLLRHGGARLVLPHPFRAVMAAKKWVQFQLPTTPPRANRALIPPGIGRTGLSFIHSKAVASAVRGGGGQNVPLLALPI